MGAWIGNCSVWVLPVSKTSAVLAIDDLLISISSSTFRSFFLRSIFMIFLFWLSNTRAICSRGHVIVCQTCQRGVKLFPHIFKSCMFEPNSSCLNLMLIHLMLVDLFIPIIKENSKFQKKGYIQNRFCHFSKVEWNSARFEKCHILTLKSKGFSSWISFLL